jgi:hypothetical protein
MPAGPDPALKRASEAKLGACVEKCSRAGTGRQFKASCFDDLQARPDSYAMRRLLAFCAGLLMATSAFAGPAVTEPPPEAMIIAMAQHFVQDRLMTLKAKAHYHIEFDMSFLYSQPRRTFWVVVGGFVSDQNTQNSFTAAVLLDCADFEKVECWSLEKLSINGQIVVDRKRI